MTEDSRSVSGPILVTGAHRSGSTWVGRMLARSPGVRYIHEPFNPDAFRPGICAARFEREFTYVCEENSAWYRDDLARCLEFRYRIPEALKTVRSASEAVRAARDLGRFTLSRWRQDRPLMKDPHAVFSTEWLARTFDMRVVVMIRHPAAFAGSIKKAGWAFRFAQFLEQPLLMRDHLAPFRAGIEALAANSGDVVDQAILLWNAIYDAVLRYRHRHPGWIYVRHEDLSRDPVSRFSDLFQSLGLKHTDSVRRAIADFSGPHNPGEQHFGSHIRRDSGSNIWNWTKRLTPGEIRHVRKQTETIADQFYGEEDWRGF